MTISVDRLTPSYLRLLDDKQISKKYRYCLEELITNIIAHNPDNIEAILLYGGIVRDSRIFDEWSDIDIIVVFEDMITRDAIDLAEILEQLEAQYSIRIDLTQISLKELIDERLARCCFNSEIINALSLRENVSTLVFGRLPNINFTPRQEKEAAIFYIMNTLSLFRRYLVEVLYRGNVEDHIKTDLIRITRWTFSTIRASLRLFDIYTHPYEYSLSYLSRIFPELDTSILSRLIHLRKNITRVDDVPEFIQLIQKAELFIEEYAALCLGRYADEMERNRCHLQAAR